MRPFLWIVGFLAFVGGLTIVASPKAAAQQGPSDVSWQQSQSVSVTLGVRDKYGVLGKYKALFVISDKKGDKIQKMVSVRGDSEADMTYPQDVALFPTNWTLSGHYSWVCIVNKEVVARGKFNIINSTHGEQIRTTDPF